MKSTFRKKQLKGPGTCEGAGRRGAARPGEVRPGKFYSLGGSDHPWMSGWRTQGVNLTGCKYAYGGCKYTFGGRNYIEFGMCTHHLRTNVPKMDKPSEGIFPPPPYSGSGEPGFPTPPYFFVRRVSPNPLLRFPTLFGVRRNFPIPPLFWVRRAGFSNPLLSFCWKDEFHLPLIFQSPP